MNLLGDENMKKSTAVSLILALALGIAPLTSGAFWWWTGKAVKMVVEGGKKHERRKWGHDDMNDYGTDDGYNPYHNHPDGLKPAEHPPVYNENELSNQQW